MNFFHLFPNTLLTILTNTIRNCVNSIQNHVTVTHMHIFDTIVKKKLDN